MKCRNSGCYNNAGYNPKTGVPNKYCINCYNKRKRQNRDEYQTKNIRRKPSVFVLRGNILTINLSGSTKKIRVDYLCRPVKYVPEGGIYGTDGHFYTHVIDIKRNNAVLYRVLFDIKKEWNREFRNLQALLERL